MLLIMLFDHEERGNVTSLPELLMCEKFDLRGILNGMKKKIYIFLMGGSHKCVVIHAIPGKIKLCTTELTVVWHLQEMLQYIFSGI